MRSLIALGHAVKLMSPTYVKSYAKRQKNDAADAAAICEAATRPTMRFVPVKGKEQQGVLMLHRTRELLIRQRTMLINALRAHLSEFGIVMRQGTAGVSTLITLAEDDEHDLIPEIARDALLANRPRTALWIAEPAIRCFVLNQIKRTVARAGTPANQG